jgi:NTE family protein
LAHIGVLQWLEEHRVPVDYVAGTSMGALVGGLHATGHDAAEMHKFFCAIDWDSTLAPTPLFGRLSFRRRQDVRANPTPLELGLRRGFQMPVAISAGHGVGLVISRFAAPYANLVSFDELPAPLRVVAVDLNSGRQEVFDHGDLFTALRASMALPAIFAPVQENGKLLVDGGALNNLPVDAVEPFHPAKIIAVAFDKPAPEDAPKSLLAVADRAIDVIMAENERRNRARADVLLTPAVARLGAAAYQEFEEFARLGYAAAEAQRDALLPLALDETAWRAYRAAWRARRRPAAIRPAFVSISGEVEPRRRAALTEALLRPGALRDVKDIEKEMDAIAGAGRYDTARYRYIERSGQSGVEVLLHEKEYGPPFLQLGFVIDGNQADGLRFGAGGRITLLDFVLPASETRLDFSVGVENRLAGELYQRLGASRWFVAPRIAYQRQNLPFYDGSKRLFEFYRESATGGLDLGYAIGGAQEIRAGYQVGHLRTTVATGPDTGASLSGRWSGLTLLWQLEGQDNAVLPRRGWRAHARGEWVTGYPGMERRFGAADARVCHAHSLPGRHFLLWNAGAGTTARDQPLGAYYDLGGIFQLGALARGQLAGSRYFYHGAYLLRSITDDRKSLLNRMYLTAGWEAGNAWRPGSKAKPFNNGVAGFIGQTPVGLLFFGAAYGERGEGKVLFRLGKTF